MTHFTYTCPGCGKKLTGVWGRTSRCPHQREDGGICRVEARFTRAEDEQGKPLKPEEGFDEEGFDEEGFDEEGFDEEINAERRRDLQDDVQESL